MRELRKPSHQARSRQMTPTHVFRVLAIGWMALIFFLSSQPVLPVSLTFAGGDKLAHAAVYAVLGFLVARSLFDDRVLTWKRALLVIGLVMAYGITDEFHQAIVPGRQVSGWDVLADGLGGLAATLVMRWHGA
jgi:VanZ family protein